MGHVNVEGVDVARLDAGWIDLRQCRPLLGA
jgi:hypothetical protein